MTDIEKARQLLSKYNAYFIPVEDEEGVYVYSNFPCRISLIVRDYIDARFEIIEEDAHSITFRA